MLLENKYFIWPKRIAQLWNEIKEVSSFPESFRVFTVWFVSGCSISVILVFQTLMYWGNNEMWSVKTYGIIWIRSLFCLGTRVKIAEFSTYFYYLKHFFICRDFSHWEICLLSIKTIHNRCTINRSISWKGNKLYKTQKLL